MSAPKKTTAANRGEKKTNPAPHKSTNKAKNASPVAPTARKGTTKIVVKCNCGFPNSLYLRGEGIPGVNWEKGIRMQCVKADEWVWETDKPFAEAQFKILLNDAKYETGENHSIQCGKSLTFVPKF